MIALGLDTSTNAGSVAIVCDDGLLSAELNLRAGLTHSERLLPAVRSLLDVAGLRPESIDLIAVAAGPGSFTGLRIGMAAAKGLALACDRPLVGFSTLETVASVCAPWIGPDTMTVCVLMNAGRGEVYRGLFRAGPAGMETIAAEAALAPADAVSGLPARCLVVGDGLATYRHVLRDHLPEHAILAPQTPFLGAGLAARGLALAARLGRDHLPPLVPNYLRVSDAERTWRG